MSELDFHLDRYSVRSINVCVGKGLPVCCRRGDEVFQVTGAKAPGGILHVRCALPQRVWGVLEDRGTV